jgi:thioredoxin 1
MESGIEFSHFKKQRGKGRFMEKTIKVDSANWEKEVLKGNGLVMVDFWAVWCGPCRIIAPVVDELAQEYEGRLRVVKLNTDENPDVASRYQIMGIPTLLFFKDGKPVDKIVGAAAKKQFKDKIDSLLAVK